MSSVLAVVNEAIAMVAPKGILDAEDQEDVETIGIAIYRLYERNERRGLMPRWVDNGRGGKTLDSSAEPTAEEVEIGERNIALMLKERRAPSTPAWNPHSVVMMTGMTPAECEHYFPTKSNFDKWAKARGIAQISRSEAASATGPRRPDPKVMEEQAAGLVKRAIEHPESMIEALKNPPANGTNGGHVKRFSSEPMDVDPNDPNVELSAEVADVPLHERPAVDMGPIQQEAYENVLEKAKARARARGQAV